MTDLDRYTIAATLGDDDTITILDVIRDGQSFIPLFSSPDAYRVQTAGTPLADKGVEIDATLLAGLLRGDERLVLDPGGANPVEVTLPR